MRILQVSHNHHLTGGSDAVYLATTKLLEDAGHEVIPFCMDSAKNVRTDFSRYFPDGADTRGASVRDAFRYFYNFEAKHKLTQLLDDIGPIDVAHLHIYHGKQTPAILHVLKRRGIPIVQSLHEYKLACPVYTLQRDGRPCEKCVTGSAFNCVRNRCKDGSLLRSAVMATEFHTARLLGDVRLLDRFLCVSEFQRGVMQRAGIPAQKLSTLHNFVAIPSAKIASDHDGYLLYLGRIEALKGLSNLINAAAATKQRLIIAGTGNWQSEMMKRIRDLPNIQYVGFKAGVEKQALIRRAWAVVVPSEWYENCPMTLLEAKSFARPVIGARIGGIPELVRHGIDGFLFEPGNVVDLSKSLVMLKKANYNDLSRRAASDAAQRFSETGYLAKLERHYQSLIRTDKQFRAQLV